jgi:hypothetical protein
MSYGINKGVRAYCRKARIRIDEYGYDATFIAPKGKTFSTEARSITFEDIDEMQSTEVLWLIDID